MKKRFLSMLVLLLMAATGAMAQTTYSVIGDNEAMFGSVWDITTTANDMTKNGDGTYSITYTNVYLTENVQYRVVEDRDWNKTYPDDYRVINIAKAGTYTVTIHFDPTTHKVYETMPGYTVTLAEDTEDADKWTVKVGEGEAQAFPVEGLNGGETVTVTYSGEKKVKSVKAVKKSNNPYANAKLGDLFYSDGTFSTTLEAGKTPIGVIAYLDQEGTDDDEITEKSNGAGHGLVLCLKDAASGADAQWSTEESAFEFGEDAKVASVDALKRTTNVSGYTNTKTLTEKTDAATKYKAAYAAKNYTGLTAPTGTTGWFLPSAQQWVKMQTGLGALEESVFTWNSWFDKSHTAADKWEAALSKAGSGNYDSMTSAYLFCWSSSEYSVSSAVGLYVGAQGTGNNYGFRWLFRTKDDKSDGNRVRPVLAF